MHTRTQAIDNKVQSIATKLIEKKKFSQLSLYTLLTISHFFAYALLRYVGAIVHNKYLSYLYI